MGTQYLLTILALIEQSIQLTIYLQCLDVIELFSLTK